MNYFGCEPPFSIHYNEFLLCAVCRIHYCFITGSPLSSTRMLRSLARSVRTITVEASRDDEVRITAATDEEAKCAMMICGLTNDDELSLSFVSAVAEREEACSGRVEAKKSTLRPSRMNKRPNITNLTSPKGHLESNLTTGHLWSSQGYQMPLPTQVTFDQKQDGRR